MRSAADRAAWRFERRCEIGDVARKFGLHDDSVSDRVFGLTFLPPGVGELAIDAYERGDLNKAGFRATLEDCARALRS